MWYMSEKVCYIRLSVCKSLAALLFSLLSWTRIVPKAWFYGLSADNCSIYQLQRQKIVL